MPCTPSSEELGAMRQRLLPSISKIRLAHFEEDMKQANYHIFKKHRIKQSLNILKLANEIFSGNLVVAVSGGKDSLVTLHLALEVNPNIPVLYNNTTVEFPESTDFVHRLAKEWNFDLHVTMPEKSFFAAVKDCGWATHEDRWCCKPYKDAPASEFLTKKKIFAEITGTTRTESIYRRSLTPFKNPKKEPYIIRVNPVYDWNSWEIWRYIRENELPYNCLYDQGYRRIGCWCCPLNGPSHYRRLKKTHPKLHDFLEGFVPPHPFFNGQSFEASQKPRS